ncbi:MAG: hypothetical protein NZ874_05975 [Fimbriimonadales bacterium]|nr:hypothetical protein [Fimbriimonadales bacterium]
MRDRRLKPFLCRPSPPARAVSRRRSASLAEERLQPLGVYAYTNRRFKWCSRRRGRRRYMERA